METITKLINTLLPGGEDRTRAQQIKDALLWMFIGAGLAIGALFYFADDDDEAPASADEYTEQTIADSLSA